MIAISHDRTTYKSIGETLCTLAKDRSETTKATNLNLIERLGRPDAIAALLQQILDSPTLVKEIAKRSYHHTNHFDKIVLIDSGDQFGYRLTLHLWDKCYSEAEINDEQIHDHRFSFWSNVLIGKMVSQNFSRDASGIVYNEYQYIPEKRATSTIGNYYINVGQSPLREAEPFELEQGGSYSLPYYRIHRVLFSPEIMTCTLVLRGPRQKNYASVFSNSKMYDPSGNQMFSPSALRDKIAVVMEEKLRIS